MKKLKYILIIIFFLSASAASAAGFNILTEQENIHAKDEFILHIFLDTEGQKINALEAEIFFEKEKLELLKIIDAGSIISLWVEKPQLLDCDANCAIRFAGIVPGGYLGSQGEVLSLIFLAKSNGEAPISVKDAQLFLNDGLGTALKLIDKEYNLSIGEKGEIAKKIVIQDNLPPEEFKIYLEKNKNVFDGKQFIIFSTKDKGSGVSGYETQESVFGFVSNNKWQNVESPYLLPRKILPRYIFVKAIDNGGNEKISILKPRFSIYHIILFCVIMILVIISWRKYGRKKK